MLRCRRIAYVTRERGGVEGVAGMIVGVVITCFAFSLRKWLDAWQSHIAWEEFAAHTPTQGS